MDLCVICNTKDNLVGGIVANDPEGNQVILQLCEAHSETTTPKQAKMAYEVRNQLGNLIAKAAENGLKIEIPTIICEGATMSAISSPQVRPVPVTRPAAPAAPPVPAQPHKLEAVTVSPQHNAIGGVSAVPSMLSDRTKVRVIPKTSAALLDPRRIEEETAFSSPTGNAYGVRDCPMCRGAGAINQTPTKEIDCPKCNGSGMML